MLHQLRKQYNVTTKEKVIKSSRPFPSPSDSRLIGSWASGMCMIAPMLVMKRVAGAAPDTSRNIIFS